MQELPVLESGIEAADRALLVFLKVNGRPPPLDDGGLALARELERPQP